jgi:Transposase
MNSTCSSLAILGLDVAKASVQAELQPDSGSKVRFAFANNPTGFKKLARVLEQHQITMLHAGLEATGPYSQALALWLYEQGYRVSLLNPRRVKDYARSAGLRNKTDALDAGIIADFVRAHGGGAGRLAAWRPPVGEVRQLQELVRRRHQLEVMLLAEKNRLEGAADTVRCSIERLISMLSAEKASLEKALAQQIRSHAQLARNHQLLCTIKGIGSSTAAVLLAEMAGPNQGATCPPSGRSGRALPAPRTERYFGAAQQRHRQRGKSLLTQSPLHASTGRHQTQCPPTALCLQTPSRWQTQNGHRLRCDAQAHPHQLRRAQTSATF